MNKEIASKWTAALRSGKYEQGKGLLRSKDNKHCCLGVLCEIAIQENLEGLTCLQDGDSAYAFDSNTQTTPTSVRDWSGLNYDLGFIPGHSSLANMNDSGKTFTEIADFIDAHVEEL